MRISDWSSDVCSSDLLAHESLVRMPGHVVAAGKAAHAPAVGIAQRAEVNDLVLIGRQDVLAADHFAGTELLAELHLLMLFDRLAPEHHTGRLQIGRASCRDSVCQAV